MTTATGATTTVATSRRRVALGWAGASAAALLAACGAQPGGGERKTAESATIVFMNRGGREAFAVHDKVVAAFTEALPQIKVTVEPVVEGSWAAKLTTQLAGGTAPDAVMCAFGELLPFCKRGDLLELDPLLSKDREVRPADWYPLALESMKYKGKLFNLPYNGGIDAQIRIGVYRESLRYSSRRDPIEDLPAYEQMLAEVFTPAFTRLYTGQADVGPTLREIKAPLQALVPKDI
jgi:ABC-type glycerol-3-phosphate transport system substrate-binding protein